jgi:hypothetical protein
MYVVTGGTVQQEFDGTNYHIVDVSYDLSASSTKTVSIDAAGSSGIGESQQNIPEVCALEQNYPNPFNPTTQIEFSIPQCSNVTLKIYDMLGKEIAMLLNNMKEPGTYTTTWNAQNHLSGVYFYRLTAGAYTMTKKLVLIK